MSALPPKADIEHVMHATHGELATTDAELARDLPYHVRFVPLADIGLDLPRGTPDPFRAS